jgi:hypothetical protein
VFDPEAEASPPPPPTPGILLQDDFFPQEGWLVDDDESFTFAYASRTYRILVKERRALWSSLRALPRGAGSVVIQVEASLANGTPRTDWYGIGCIASSEAAYLFGISPDGYYTIAFDSAASEDIQLERLVEDYADDAFGPAREPNRLRAECLHENGQNRLRLSVNGRRLVERTHRSRIGPFAGVELFVYSGRGRTDVRFDDLTVREPTG